MTTRTVHFMFAFYANFCILSSFTTSDNVQDFGFGYGAEDNEDNTISTKFREGVNSENIEDFFASKSTRQEHEDVEVVLNSGPMMAPDIILNRFVDSRLTVSNAIGLPHPQGDNVDDEETIQHDSSLNEIFSNIFAIPNDMPMYTSSASDITENLVENNPCHMKYKGPSGSFDLNFRSNCTIQIAAPDPLSRLILTCSPMNIGDCFTHKDSLSVNLVGDTKFGTNTYMYCGRDMNVKAISVRNKLAIRIKQADELTQSSRCTFHSRKYRQYDPSASKSYTCGRFGRNSKIIGGRRVPPGLFPWVAQLDITRTDGSQTACTGSIVSPTYILTAAHCMKRAESISAFMGGTDRHDIVGTEVLIQAEKYIIHRKWSSKTLLADIALVKLTEPVQYTDDISPICLPEGKLLTEDFSGRRGVAVGWGRVETRKKAPRRLYRVKLPLLSDTRCHQIYRRFFLPNVMMCTDSKRDAAICYGMT